MNNNKRKEGWYWCKLNNSKGCIPYYFDGDLFITNGYELDDESFEVINEKRITPPDEPNILDKAIELISINADKEVLSVRNIILLLEGLKATI
jgi:hypothetical protein